MPQDLTEVLRINRTGGKTADRPFGESGSDLFHRREEC
jgi:hypothetical protein